MFYVIRPRSCDLCLDKMVKQSVSGFSSNFIMKVVLSTVFCLLISTGSCGSSDAESVNFLIIGDWGGLPDFPYRTPIEWAVGKQMGRLADKLNAQFVLALGDNFYFDGVKDVDDPRFKETFDSAFSSTSLGLDWYFVAGNHDHNGNVSAQIAYSHREKRWNFPNYYYKLDIPLAGGSTMEILMVDTIILCGNSDADYLGLQPNGTEFKHKRLADQQWAWLEKSLQTSKAEYLMIGGHYPVLSVAEHGPTKCLVDRLMPMLYKYKVSAYLCGHDHNLQHLEYAQNNHTVQYFLSGAANFIDPSMAHQHSVPKGSLKFHWRNVLSLGGFAYAEASSKNVTVTFVDAGARKLHTKTIFPRKL